MDTEKLLPMDMRLDSYFESCADELEAELSDLRLKNAAKDILDYEVEFSSMNNLLAFASLALSVNENLVLQQGEGSYETMYRSVVFAYQMAGIIQGNTISFNATPYLSRLFQNPDGYDELIRDTQLYLEDNPNLDTFIGHYADELDGGRGFVHLAEISAALVFMLSERALAEEFIAEETQHCTVEELDS